MKTLGALVVAMTVGSIAMILMETAPIRPPVTNLSAVAGLTDESFQVVSQTDVAIKAAKWRHIIIHTAMEALEPDLDCHFVIDPTPGPDGRSVRATTLWHRQVGGNHVFVAGYNWNADSIAICLIGDYSQTPPAASQLQALVGLVRSIQQTCGIPAERVYLARDIDPRGGPTWAAFPAKQFNASLLKLQRP
jgi:hypothetical protein